MAFRKGSNYLGALLSKDGLKDLAAGMQCSEKRPTRGTLKIGAAGCE
jgi:hypothetical protein